MKAKFLALAALLFGLAACQTDPQDLDVQMGGEQEVMLTVSLPETTRANSAEGALGNVDMSVYDIRYILEIYRVENNVVLYENCQSFVETSDNTSMVFPVRLAPGYNYRIVAWADIVKNGSKEDRYYYTEDGLDNVVIKDNGTVNWNAMDETRDAYTCVKVVDGFSSSSDLDMELTRPFAKVRVVATDIEDIRNVGLEPISATVVYAQDMYFKYNAVADIENKGVANDARAKSHTFTYETTATQYVDNNGEYTLFSDYIFVPSTGTAKFNLVVKDANGNEIKANNFNTDIFVERNKLTTIKGDVLTTGGNVTIKVDNGLGVKETYTYVDTAEDLQQMINNAPANKNTNITLGGDIDLNDLLNAGILSTTRAGETAGLVIPANKSVVLDLNGYTISQSKAQTGAYAMIDNKGTLTIEDSSANKSGKIAYGDTGNGGNYVSNTISNSGVLTIKGGTIENNSLATVAANGYPHPIDNSGTLTIKGGTFTNNANYSSMRIWCTTDDDTIVTIDGGTFNGSIDFQTPNASANKGTLTIKGGTFNADTYTKCAVRLLGFGADVDEMNGYILGGHFNGAIALKNWSGSELNSKVFNITGGTFTTAAKEATNAALINDDYTWAEGENGLWTVVRKPDVAKIGEVGYTTLAKAVAAVEDGGTITLVANEVFTETNRYNNGGWWDGLGYSGDKSFTLDLNGYTISQNGALNDYLLWFKNVGSKANTITIKNGTLDAGTTAFCALCTASSHDNQLTINLENVNLINNNSNGSTIKVRAGSVVNVNAGSKITGKNSYLGIENWNATVNVYDGAEIYMNGTSSYNGCLIGVGGNGTINVYGGYGKGVKGGFIAMTSGGVINVAGGEWIANTNGTIGDNSNVYVLTAQNNKYESGYAGASIINVTGGTFRGGMDAWVLNDVTVEKAELNIKGGNFNANPESYVVDGYESVVENGVYTVGKPQALANFEAAIAQGGNVTLTKDITLLETIKIENKVVIDLNVKTVTDPLFSAFEVKSGAELTIKNGKVVAYESTVRAIGGKAIIESGEYTSTGTALDSPATYRYSLDCREGGELIINGGTFKSNNGMINVGSTVTINGGKFENVVEKTMTRHFAYVSAPLTINDGEFYGKANGSAGGCFFCGAGASGDIQINGGKFTSLWTSGSVNRIFEVYFGGTINVTGGMFNTNGGIVTFVTENTDEATKAAYPYVAK